MGKMLFSKINGIHFCFTAISLFRFWAIKYLVLIGAIVGAFFIPEDEAGTFGTTWMYFGLIGGFCFILIQLVLVVDFAHRWAESWVDKYEETSSKAW